MQAIGVGVLILCGIELLLWLWLAWGWWCVARDMRYLVAHPPTHWQPVSVVLCLRNEAENVQQIITALLAQDYPAAFEVVAVNDRSSDDTGTQLDALATQNTQLRVLHLHEIPTGWAGKKYALTQGIAHTHHALLAFTDADCQPGPEWLRNMVAPMHQGRPVVLGFSPYADDGSLLGAWQRHESCWQAFQYLGWARAGMPYMAVGRSLAYTRSFFDAAGGVGAHASLPSGDDDLLIHHHAQAGTVAVAAQAAAAVPTRAMHTWAAYLTQRRRHLQAGKRYKPHVVAVLWLMGVCSSLTLILPLLAVLTGAGWLWQLWLYRLLYQAVVLSLANGLTHTLRHTFALHGVAWLSSLLQLLALWAPTRTNVLSKTRGHSSYDNQ